METKRPKLTDPQEFAIVRDMYFEKDSAKEKLDPVERLDRFYSKNKNLKNNAR
jgi:hypothetical protein